MQISAALEHFRELYRYRVLIECLVWREVKARYRGSMLGYFWTLLNPLLLLLVYRLVFTEFTRAVGIDNYAIFVFVGILPWLWLSTSISNGTTSIAQGGSLITRVCIPPQVLPAVVVFSNLVNFALTLPVAVVAAAAGGISPGFSLALLPIVIALELTFLYGLTLLVATLTVPFRDVQFLVQNLLMIWFFLTPIVFPLSVLPEKYHALLLTNPATAIILLFQQIVFERRVPDLPLFGLAAVWSSATLFLSVSVFESMRNSLAEEI